MSTHDWRATHDEAKQGMPIGVISDVRLYRDGIAQSLLQRPELTVAWTARDQCSALECAADYATAAVVLDLATIDSLKLLRALRRAFGSLVIVGVASRDVDSEIIACAEAGVSGLVSCEGSLDDVTVAVSRAIAGEMSCSPRAAAVLTQRLAMLSDVRGMPANEPVYNFLTQRENIVLNLIELGLSNKEIASRLHIQVATVKNHVHSVLEKMHVGSRGEAAAKHRGSGPVARIS
jgi:two-component system, NarL family, nitrate/nitrite response regulator NarL